MLEVLNLLYSKSARTRAGSGSVGRKCAHALGGVKKARSVVAPEVPIHLDRVNTARNISLGEVEAVSGHRAQD